MRNDTPARGGNIRHRHFEQRVVAIPYTFSVTQCYARFMLSRHRLIHGDATRLDAIGSEEIDLVVT